MKSSYLDSIKVILSERYEISDGDYATLSDIFLSRRMDDLAVRGGLLQVMVVMESNGVKLPISLNYLQKLWERDYVSFKFVSLIGDLVKGGLLSLKKVKLEKYADGSIAKDESDMLDQEIYVVVTATPLFKELYALVEPILTSGRVGTSVFESGQLARLPKAGQAVIRLAKSLLFPLSIQLDMESFETDDMVGTVTMNLLLNDTSSYKVSESKALQMAKRYIKQASDISMFKEKETQWFLSITISKQLSTKEIHRVSEGIFALFENLEVNEVKE